MEAQMDPERLPYRPCVGIMVLNDAGLVWVGHRSEAAQHNEGQGRWWQMPQGGIDEDEDPQTAALRELAEETGMRTVEPLGALLAWQTYDLPPHLIGKAWGGRYRGQKQKWFAMRFTGAESEIDIAPQHGPEPEFDAWRWVAAGELTELVVPFKRAVYTEVVHGFAALIGPLER